MTVLRIVPDFAASDPQEQARFYRDLFGLDVVMNQGFIVTLASEESMRPQISLMAEGGSGTPIPALSIEVTDVDELHERANQADLPIVYPLTDEPWGVRRFFTRDMGGRIINILQHIG
jgi:catechol 2,3-dioxygenase-like lactoylglutathione lyase family enzyme